MHEDEADPAPRHRRSPRATTFRSDPRLSMWLADELHPDAAKLLARTLRLPNLQRLAVMPDVHASREVCVGTAFATTELLYPTSIGGDIGCGMAALRLNPGATALDAPAALRTLSDAIHVMVRPDTQADAPLQADLPPVGELSAPTLARAASRDGRLQLGTLGRGNHFLELQRADDGDLWLMVHSGSRAMGQAVAAHHARIAAAGNDRRIMPSFSRSSTLATDFLRDHDWCVAYASANRVTLLRDAAAALELNPDWSSLLDVPHNFIRVEANDFVVHRKGAAPAHADQPGLIPGSAGDMSVHVMGRGCPESLWSSSHGAGRRLSRSEANRSVSTHDVLREMTGVAFDASRAHGLRDEAPSVYRELRQVIKAQRALVKITRTLRPLVSFKASG
ncbi:MAG: RtcB family protein [Phycisphaerales bacterium]